MEYHYPVMVKEVGQAILNSQLSVNAGKRIVIFDGTLGHAGHVIYLHNLIGGNIGLYVATDADKKMFDVAQTRIKETLNAEQRNHIKLFNCSYTEFGALSEELGTKYDVAFLDLGVNLWHFKQHERGFSIKGEGDLDMRYNQEATKLQSYKAAMFQDERGSIETLKYGGLTAADVVNTYSEQQLIDMFVLNSEISLGTSQKIAAEIVRMRKNKPFQTSTELNNLTKKLEYSARVAAIVFQAIRIEVNQEFSNIRYTMEECYKGMNPGGILIILSYHSGEDRIVKELMKKLEAEGRGKVLTKHAIPPSYQETQGNKPSRSAKMRVFQFQ